MEIKQGIKLASRTNKWSSVESQEYNGHTLYLMENDTYGDETDYVIINENNEIVIEDVYNGWSDLDELIENLKYEHENGYSIAEEYHHLMKYVN